MISCKKATELMSKAMEEKLSFVETAQLNIHLFICEFCQLFKVQLMQLRNALRKGDTSNAPTISNSCKTKLKEIVKKK